MISIDDWSDLITVNYLGGMGGDFFCFLLNGNIEKQSPSFLFDENYRYDFYEHDAFLLTLKTLTLFFKPLNKELDNQSKTKKLIAEIYEDVYVEGNPEQTALNLRSKLYNMFSYRFDRKRVLSTHFSNKPLPINSIFPKSSNIFLGSLNTNYFRITRFLAFYKTVLPLLEYRNNKLFLPFSMIDHWYKNEDEFLNTIIFYDPTTPNNELFVDMFDFVVNERNYNKDLSDVCGFSIQMDPMFVKNYKSQTSKILEPFGINIDCNYSEQQMDVMIVSACKKLMEEKKNV